MRASASMPLVSQPVEIDGYTLLDGGMTDSIPLEFLESQGFARNIVILTQPRNYVKKKNALVPLLKIGLNKFPGVAEAMKNRHIIYNRQTEYVFEQEKKGRVFVICPPESLKISRTEKNPKELQRVYDIGRQTAEKLLENLKKWMNFGG